MLIPRERLMEFHTVAHCRNSTAAHNGRLDNLYRKAAKLGYASDLRLGTKVYTYWDRQAKPLVPVTDTCLFNAGLPPTSHYRLGT